MRPVAEVVGTGALPPLGGTEAAGSQKINLHNFDVFRQRAGAQEASILTYVFNAC